MPDTATTPAQAAAAFTRGLVSVMAPEPPAASPAAPPAVTQTTQPTPPVTKPDAPASVPPPAAPPEEKIPRTAQEWKKFTAKRDADIAERDKRIAAAEARALELETKLKSTAPTPELNSLKADLDKLRKERDEYDEKLKVVAVTQHPRFKQEFEQRLQAQIDLAKKIVPEEHQETVERILSLPDGKFKDARVEELMGELSQVQISRIGAILNNVTEINNQRQDIIKNAREEYEKMTAAQQSQTKQQAEAMEQALKESLSKAGEHPLYQKSEDAEWNKDVETRLQQAEKLARSPLSVGDSTRIVLDHLALPVVQKQLDSTKAEVEKLKAQIADFTKSNPELASRTAEIPLDEGGGTPIKINAGSSPMDAARAWMKSLPKFQ